MKKQKHLKEAVIDSVDIDRLREEYTLRYYGIYSEDEIRKGIIDKEIVIDILCQNSSLVIPGIEELYESILKEEKKELDSKRYLKIQLRSSINNMNISKWEKIFCENYYSEVNYDGKKPNIPSGVYKIEKIREDIKEELEKLYAFSEDKDNFKIDPESVEVEREYESEIKALKGREESVEYLKENKKKCLEEIANRISEQLYEEYKHIVDFIKDANYEDSFKVMMLRETLMKTYKKDKKEEKEMVIIKKRKLKESISSHMILNDEVLKIVYKNVDEYDNFANLYYAALAVYNNIITETSTISLDGVETYGKGKWIKFEGKSTNEKEYIENSKKLSSLVQGTPWCTKTLASSHLKQGDFYVFVDNEGKPHIAVKMNGNSIDEVRGIQNGSAQEIEEEYRDVAISFLENNKDIRYGKEWLEKEEWNKRLVFYNEAIKNNTFKLEFIEKMMEDMVNTKNYKNHGSKENSNLKELKENLYLIKDKIATYYNCSEEEIALGDVDFDETDITICPYKIILGNVWLGDSKVTDLGKLQYIGGDADFYLSKVAKLGNLQTIGGYVDFRYSEVTDLGNLEYIGGYAIFSYSKVTDLGKLQYIGGYADFYLSKVTNLGKLQYIGGNAYFENSKVTDLGNLEYIGGYAYFTNSKVIDLDNLEYIGGNADFRDSQVTNLSNLKYIGGKIYAYHPILLEQYEKLKNKNETKTQTR